LDRVFVYPQAIPQDTDLLNTNRSILIAIGRFAQDVLGTSTLVGGLPCTPNSPPNLTVVVGAGSIYAVNEEIDATAYGSLGTDSTLITKQGINLATTTLACAAPATPGYTIDYLIEGAYEDEDGENAVLPYYNSSNPASPYSGPSNSGSPQPTMRQGFVNLVAKAGVPAPTGTQVAPAVDAGFVPLYIVTVAYGQTAIVAGDISVAPGAPFIQAIGEQLYLALTGGTLTGPLNGTVANFATVTVNGINVQNAAILTSGLLAAALIPEAGVTQFQADLSIAASQITGPINAATLQSESLANAATPNTVVGRDANANIWASYFNQSSENNENPAVSQVMVTTGTDGYTRKASVAYVFEQMMLSGAVTLVADSGQAPPASGTPGSLWIAYSS
jgi:hypothetical protein